MVRPARQDDAGSGLFSASSRLEHRRSFRNYGHTFCCRRDGWRVGLLSSIPLSTPYFFICVAHRRRDLSETGKSRLAHRGVLFLDEFPEFEKRVIESLRQPLEDNIVSISRAKGSAIFPSNFILVAAMNPCPCGNASSKNKVCICKPSDLDRYKRKLSGPIMDRIDLWVSVGNVDYKSWGRGDGEKKVKR